MIKLSLRKVLVLRKDINGYLNNYIQQENFHYYDILLFLFFNIWPGTYPDLIHSLNHR